MRMIEFDKARRAMLKELEGRIGSIGALRIIGALEDITIEAEPVKHGRWVWEETGKEDYEMYWACSVCGDKSYYAPNYCPNCGVRMDGIEQIIGEGHSETKVWEVSNCGADMREDST